MFVTTTPPMCAPITLSICATSALLSSRKVLWCGLYSTSFKFAFCYVHWRLIIAKGSIQVYESARMPESTVKNPFIKLLHKENSFQTNEIHTPCIIQFHFNILDPSLKIGSQSIPGPVAPVIYCGLQRQPFWLFITFWKSLHLCLWPICKTLSLALTDVVQNT